MNKHGINKYNGSFLSLIFLSLVTGFIALALFAKTLPLLAAKTLYFCQQFISNTILQIPYSFHNVLIMILIIVLALGVLSFLVQLYKTRKLLKKLLIKKVAIPAKLQKILIPLTLETKLCLIKDSNLFSFCYGVLSPRIILTTALVSSLTDQELEAVLLHEKAHMKNLDPFKILLGKTVVSMFFFLPIFSELNKNMVATNELIADRFAINAQRSTSFLRGALKKILMEPQVALATVPAISNPDYLEIRIRRLVNPLVKHYIGVSWISFFSTAIFLVISLFLLQTPVSAFQMEHSMSMDPSYFMCSSDNACRQECSHNASTAPVTNPEHLFSPKTFSY